MDKLSHLEQYKMLREEIMLDIQQRYRTEVYAAIAVGALYTWLLSDKGPKSVPITPNTWLWYVLWFTPFFVMFLTGARCVFLTLEINRIGKYLKRIEEAEFADDTKVPGWERSKIEGQGRWFDRITIGIASGLWVGPLILTFFLSLWLS